MAYTLLPQVEQEIERVFAPEHRDHVRSRLAEQVLPLGESAPPPRVHIAILWLSQGELPRFERALQIARFDWRDTLVAAGLGNGDWREVLARRGIDSVGW